MYHKIISMLTTILLLIQILSKGKIFASGIYNKISWQSHGASLIVLRDKQYQFVLMVITITLVVLFKEISARDN